MFNLIKMRKGSKTNESPILKDNYSLKMKPSKDYSTLTPTQVERKSSQAAALDAETQALLHSLREKDRRFRITATVFFLILFGIGVLGIYYQNELASQNKSHIDCIVQLFTTPVKPGQGRYINDLQSCHIQVVRST
jgi:hypothetical protein